MQSFKNNMKLTPDKYLTDQEIGRFEKTLEHFYPREFRNCLILEFAMRTGCRASEILNIKKADVNLEAKSVYIHTLKGGTDRDIPLPSKLFTRLKKWMDQCETELLFDFSYVYFRSLWVSYRPVEKKLHALRHTAAIRFYKKSRNIHMVKTILGHTDINSTMVYLDFVESKEKMRAII